MFIIAGLGNPGKKYATTRHNTGFMMADKIKEKYNFPDFRLEHDFQAEISKGRIEDKDILLVKPQTFMNESGEAIQKILSFYKITPDNLLVIHDDMDLPLGKHRMSEDSSSAGHNGVQNIIDKIGTQNFKRLRIGIANDDLRIKIDPSDFVLQKFSEEELDKIDNVLEEIKEMP